jgi:beta-lactamase superfamily II metal-dependent hydrolase
MPRLGLAAFLSLRRAASVALALLLVPAVALAITGNGKLQLHHIDVGQGDAILLISPNGQTALFDSGNYLSCTGIKSYLQGLGASTIDYHFASHYHSDHIGCIDDLAAIGITIGTAGYDRGYSYSSGTYTNYVNTLGAKRTTMAVNQVVTLDAGQSNPVEIRCVALNGAGVYSPTGSDENAKSLSLLVSYGNFQEEISGDLTGDGALDVETTVGPLVGDVEVYKAHHHGSLYSNNDNWLDATTPEVCVIQVGNNSYGHPTAEALGRMHTRGIHTYWTQTGSGASPNPTWDKIGGTIVVQADPGPGAAYTVAGTGFTDTYYNDGSLPPINTTEYPTALTMLKGSLTTGDVTRLQVSDDSRIGVAAGVSGGQYYTDWYASTFLDHPPLNLLVTCETSFTVSRTQTLYVYNFTTAAWEQVNSDNVSTTDETKTWSTSSPAAYVGPSNEVRFRVKGNNRNSTYTSRGDFLSVNYDYAQGTGMVATREPAGGRTPVIAALAAAPATAGAPGTAATHVADGRAHAIAPQAAVLRLEARPLPGGARLEWAVRSDDHVDGFNVYREHADGLVVFAGNESGVETEGDEVRFRFADAGTEPSATYWLGIRSCSGPEALIGPIRVEAAGLAAAELALRVAPNPAGAATRFEFALDREAEVKLEVFDLQGRLVATPLAGRQPAGPVRAGWDLRRDAGGAVEPGLYFARLQALGRTLYSRVTVIAP